MVQRSMKPTVFPPLACAHCILRDLCLPGSLTEPELERLEDLVRRRQAVPRGTTLYRAGARCDALYAIRVGFFKSRTLTEHAREHVTGFHMAGDLLGLDGLAGDRHTCDAVALEDSQVCAIPITRLQTLSREFPGLQHRLLRFMGRELVRDHDVMQWLGELRAEERVAAFVLDLAQRQAARGLSPRTLVLRMTRQEIGAFLGLKLETVSRSFSQLQEDGLLEVRHRHIRILEAAALGARANAAAARA
jgi:CRP/FNR family transcriptional regulator